MAEQSVTRFAGQLKSHFKLARVGQSRKSSSRGGENRQTKGFSGAMQRHTGVCCPPASQAGKC